MEVSAANSAGAKGQDSGQQHVGDNDLQSQQQQQQQQQLPKTQIIKISANSGKDDNGSYVNKVVADVTAVNNGATINNNSLQANQNGDAYQQATAADAAAATNVNMAPTNLESTQADSKTNISNNINTNSNVPTNFTELDTIHLSDEIDSVLRKLVESVVEKYIQLEEEEASKRQKQLIYNSTNAPVPETTTTTTTTITTQPLNSTSPSSIEQISTAVQSHQEQSNQVQSEQPSVELVDNSVVEEQQQKLYDQSNLSPDEVTSDLVIDAGDLQEGTPVAPEQKADSTDGDDDNDNTDEKQQQQSKVEPNIGSGKEPVSVTEATGNTITATTTSPVVSRTDGDKLDEVVCESSKSAIVEHTADQELDDLKDEEEKEKEMVTLRNLEISPPPQSTSAMADADVSITMETIEKADENDESTNLQARSAEKRKRTTSTSTTDPNESVESVEGGRSKRQRTQTKLFQIGETHSHDDSITSVASSRSRASTKASSRGSRKKSTNSSTASESANISANDSTVTQQPNNPANDLHDVIFYEKNDYLAIRNEENTFYLCQLTENVRSKRPTIRIKWLDTNNDGKTYFLTSQYDMVPQKSIIMVVGLNKLKSEKKGEQLFSLADQDKDQIMERLKRSLSFSGNS